MSDNSTPENLPPPVAPEKIPSIVDTLDPDLAAAYRSGNAMVIQAVNSGMTTSQMIVNEIIRSGGSIAGLPPGVQTLVTERRKELDAQAEAENERLRKLAAAGATLFAMGTNGAGAGELYGAGGRSYPAGTQPDYLQNRSIDTMSSHERQEYFGNIGRMTTGQWLQQSESQQIQDMSNNKAQSRQVMEDGHARAVKVNEETEAKVRARAEASGLTGAALEAKVEADMAKYYEGISTNEFRDPKLDALARKYGDYNKIPEDERKKAMDDSYAETLKRAELETDPLLREQMLASIGASRQTVSGAMNVVMMNKAEEDHATPDGKPRAANTTILVSRENEEALKRKNELELRLASDPDLSARESRILQKRIYRINDKLDDGLINRSYSATPEEDAAKKAAVAQNVEVRAETDAVIAKAEVAAAAKGPANAAQTNMGGMDDDEPSRPATVDANRLAAAGMVQPEGVTPANDPVPTPEAVVAQRKPAQPSQGMGA